MQCKTNDKLQLNDSSTRVVRSDKDDQDMSQKID